MIEGAKRRLEKLRIKLEADDSWETKRRIVEMLVEGIEVQSTYDAMAPRGQQRSATLLVTFAFEEAAIEKRSENRHHAYSAIEPDAAAKFRGAGQDGGKPQNLRQRG